MHKLNTYYFSLLLLTTSIGADIVNDTLVEEHRVPRVSGRIVKVYSGNRPEPYMCSSEGYKSDPNSCASFYRCVKERNGKFNVFRYQCAPGTIYDPDLETCNHPRSTRRTECGGMIVPTQSVDAALVNEIETQKELPRPIKTNELAFIKDTSTTQPAESQWITSQSVSTLKPLRTTVHQTQSPSFYLDTTKYNADYNYVISTNQPWISKKEKYTWTKTTSIPKITTGLKNTDICSDDGFIGDTENCRKFYRCVGNQRGGFYKYEFLCSESTVWDEEIQSCNHPWAVKRSKCGRSISFTDNSQTEKPLRTTTISDKPMQSTAEYGQKLSKTVQQQLQISHGSKVTQTQTQISHSDEVIQNQTQIYYGDRVNHNKDFKLKQNQTQISHSSAVSQTQTQIDYGSKGMQTQLQIDHSKDSSQSQTQIHESTTSQTSTTKQISNQNNECSESGFMGDSNDCKKFYRCVNSGNGKFTKYEYICGDGTVWDQSIEACNHAWAVKECGGQSQSLTQTSTMQSSTYYADTTTQSTSEVPESDIDDIDVGYGNQGQTETASILSTTSTKTTSYYEEPHHDTTKAPQKEPNKNNECKSNGFMGDENDCKKFYRCVDNGMGGYTRHEFKCGEGTVWDSSIEACNHAWAVEKCGGNGEVSESSQTSEQTTVQTISETIISSTTMVVDKNTDEPIRTTTSSSIPGSTTTEANEGNVCKSSGFMGDSKHCKKFYRCVDNGDGTYTRHEFTCGEGTVWDSKIEACNHEWAVETCGSNSESTTSTYSSTSQQSILQDEGKENEPTTTQGYDSEITTQSSLTTTTMRNDISSTDETCTGNGFVGDKTSCKKFYRCVDNGNGGYDRYEFTCGEGTVWDASISACNHAWAVKDCGASDTSSSQSNGESSSEGTVSSTETEKEESSQHTTDKSTSTTGDSHENEVTEGDCESEGFFGSFIDCKKFIRCVDDGKGSYTKYEFTCGEGTTWNQNIAACDHPSPNRPCGQDYQSTTKESHHIYDEMVTETTTKMTSTTSNKGESESEVTKKPSSSGICDSEGFNGHPTDCKKFYRCVDNGEGGYTKYEFTCGDGTVWNQEILACDHESDDKSCLSSGVRPTEATHSQSSTSGSQSESTTSSSSTTTSSQEINKTEPSASTSNDKCVSDGFFAHPHDCKKFVRCVNNGNGEFARYEFSCGEGTVWVQEIQACDHDTGDTKCGKQSESTTKPHDNVSSSTTESSYSSSTESTESQTQSKEDDEYQTTKQPTTTNSGECTSEGYFANKNDCRKFYRCVDNGEGGYTKYDFVCGEGTAWDSNIGNCNHINEVASCTINNEDNSHTQQTMKDEEISQTTESTSSTTLGTTSSSESNGETGSGSNTEGTDKCESEGYHGNSKDCKKFYRCVDDGNGGLTKYDFTCGEGTIWDQDITNCNHPQDVTNPSCKTGAGGAEEESQTSSTSSSTSSTTNSPESTSSSSSSESTTQSSSNCTQEESSKKPVSSKDISCEKAGYYPNPNDCKKFYRCVDWDGDGKRFSVYHFECGEGTIWDPALDTCNHEESVYPPRDCSQSQAQPGSPSETTTAKNEEETTKQDSTNTEQTTTQESTTSEQTTEQEKTTTQQSTTSEKTTTEQTTTSEQTTTQQSTTSEPTTTEQSTTSEQTTTQQSTTSEQTTNQETTTSEQTTTQETTTSEQTTTQESTTSEQTTTQESTTSEQTTTQEPTSEQTTQESTTSEQTTQESTTSEQITEESTTTEQSTTEQTTEKSSEQTESTTTEGTTEGSTEEESSSTTEQSSTTEGEQQSTTESTSSSEKECPETEDDQYLFVCPTSFKRHPKYCNMFYQCTEDDDTHEVKIATFKCPNETIYDETKTQCVEEKKADKKCDGEMARRHRFKRLNRDSKDPITVENGKKSCPSEGYFAFEKNIECSSGFLKCNKNKSGKIRGYVHQCPEGYLFWTISRRCELAANIRDCKKSSNDWKGRWNIPVDRKNVAF